MLKLLPLLLLLPLVAAAQTEVGLDVGAAVPVAELGDRRDAGLSATLSLGVGNGGRGLGARAELSAQRVFDSAPAPGGTRRGDFSAYSARGAAVYTFTDGPAAVYAVAGLGAYGLTVEGQTNPYGVAGGTHFALGTRVPAGVVDVVAEVQAVVLLTDYGAGAFYGPTTYLPLTVGVRF